MSHQYRHRSPFRTRHGASGHAVPIVVIDAPSPLGTAASTFVALGLLGAADVAMTSIAQLRPHLRSARLPTLSELTAGFAEYLRNTTGDGAGTVVDVDVIGVGLGAVVALGLALEGGPVRRIVAVDAPVPTFGACQVLVTERFFGVTSPSPLRGVHLGDRLRGAGPAAPAGYEGALPEGMDPAWFRRPVEHHPSRWQDPLLRIADTQLAGVEHPVLCINSPKSDVVTGADHIARLVPTASLLRLRTMDTADELEQARVADAIHDFLWTAKPSGMAYRGADEPRVAGRSDAAGLTPEDVASVGTPVMVPIP